MPSFEQLILSTPIGFLESCLAINALAESNEALLQELTKEAWNEVTSKANAQNLATVQHANARKGLVTIIRSMRQAQPPSGLAATANALVTNTCLSQSCVEKVLLSLKELSKAPDTASAGPVKVAGKLSNFQWRISVAATSNACKNLFTPLISIRYDITSEDGSLVPYTAEMTVDQFKEFRSTFEKVARVMDSI